MVSPLEIYTEWQRRQHAREFEHLGEVVDLEGFRDVCIGLSDWTTGYQVAFENLKRNILIPLADWHATVEAVVEGQDAEWCASVQRPRTWPTSSASRPPVAA